LLDQFRPGLILSMGVALAGFIITVLPRRRRPAAVVEPEKTSEREPALTR
jgi:hypothetical protein